MIKKTKLNYTYHVNYAMIKKEENALAHKPMFMARFVH